MSIQPHLINCPFEGKMIKSFVRRAVVQNPETSDREDKCVIHKDSIIYSIAISNFSFGKTKKIRYLYHLCDYKSRSRIDSEQVTLATHSFKCTFCLTCHFQTTLCQLCSAVCFSLPLYTEMNQRICTSD